jgi:transposase
VDAHGMPLRVIVTAGTVADCTQAQMLTESFDAEALIADKAYDTDAIIEVARDNNMEAVIPPKKNRKQTRPYDTHTYKMRHLVENAFLHLKGWRAIATRYAKKTSSFLAIVQIRCALIWAYIS